MSHFLDRLTFFKRIEGDFADGHGITTSEDRRWEDGYRKRWQHDKIVRSTHGANCTGSCSWKIYVKGGIVTWETQQTDYPRTRPDLPNHEPRGCSRGASYSWYLYSGNRVKYPLVRSRLLKLWREARVLAWRELQLVPLLRQPREISAGALAPIEVVAAGARGADACRSLGLDRRGPAEAGGLHEKARARRLRACHLG